MRAASRAPPTSRQSTATIRRERQMARRPNGKEALKKPRATIATSRQRSTAHAERRRSLVQVERRACRRPFRVARKRRTQEAERAAMTAAKAAKPLETDPPRDHAAESRPDLAPVQPRPIGGVLRRFLHRDVVARQLPQRSATAGNSATASRPAAAFAVRGTGGAATLPNSRRGTGDEQRQRGPRNTEASHKMAQGRLEEPRANKTIPQPESNKRAKRDAPQPRKGKGRRSDRNSRPAPRERPTP